MKPRTRTGTVAGLLTGLLVVPLSLVACLPAAASTHRGDIEVWLTDLAAGTQLERGADLTWRTGNASRGPAPDRRQVVTLDEHRTYQQMTGFGASFTDSSAWLVGTRLDAASRDALMRELFDPEHGIGLSFLRQPMGATDFTVAGNYSYDDMPPGQTDPELVNFSVEHDQAYIIPLLQQALALNPSLTIMASPWSPPGWMKTSDSMIGGTLEPAAYRPLAEYFAAFVGAYADHGLPVRYVTPNNEPLHLPGGYPGMSLSPEQANDLIMDHLGPVLHERGLPVEILGYDHNWDVTSYPETHYANPQASPHVAGTAWHCYAGSVQAQSISHNNYPGKATFVSECSGGDWEGGDQARFNGAMNLVVNAPRHWAQGVIRWNLALDDEHGPTNGGCDVCRALVTVTQQDDGSWSYAKDVEYYALGHASAFVPPGAHRIASSATGGVDNVAYANPDGTKVLVAHNPDDQAQTFRVQWGNRWFEFTLESGAAATFVWHGTQRGRPGKGAIGAVDFPFEGADGSRPVVSYHAGLAAHHDRVRIGERWFGYTLPTGASLAAPSPGTPIERSGWTASASASALGDPPANAIDGDPGSRWSTGHGMQPGDWFQLDLGARHELSELVIDAGGGADFLRGYEVYVSEDGHDWGEPIAAGPGRPVLRVLVPALATRFIRIVNTGSAGNWWSIHDLDVLAPAPAGEHADPEPASDALQRRTGRLPDGTRVEAVYHPGGPARSFDVQLGRDTFRYRLPATAAAVFTVR